MKTAINIFFLTQIIHSQRNDYRSKEPLFMLATWEGEDGMGGNTDLYSHFIPLLILFAFKYFFKLPTNA